MLTRLTHAGIAFAVTAVLYQTYVLAVAPLVEPPPAVAWRQAPGLAGVDGASADAPNKYQELLAAYFSSDHWCFARPPKALENESRTVLAIFDGDRQTPDGKLIIPRCALLFFPTPRDRSAAPPRNAIVLESSGGAELQMEAAAAGVTTFGRLQYGQLLGEIVVRSDMNEPGPHDDLRLTTRDVYINEDLVRTDQAVNLQLGEHRAFGRELELRWLKAEGSDASPMGLYGAFDDLVIKHDVSLIIASGKLRFPGSASLPHSPAEASAGPAPNVALSSPPEDAPDEQATAAPPIRIKSAGPFRIDFSDYKASFVDNVRAWQLQPDGALNELLARELTLFFTKTTRWNDEAPAAGDAPARSLDGLSFEPGSIEALGAPGQPVAVRAPSYQGAARGERLWIELVNRRLHRVTLEGGDEVELAHGSSQIHARTLQYTLPPLGSGQRLGTLMASGRGRLASALNPARPSDLLEVSWNTQLQLIRRRGQPVLILDGRPIVTMTGGGKLWADQLQLFLREAPVAAAESVPAAPAPDATAASLASSIVPELLTASGRVAIDAPELTGQVNQLSVRIEQTSATEAAGGAATPVPSGAPRGVLKTSPLGGSHASLRRYDVSGVELEIDVVMRDKQAQVRGLRVEGSVVFRETSPVDGGAQPLQITAEHVRVTQADTPNAEIEIEGGGGENGLQQQLAEIVARGATLRAPLLTVNRGASQAWIRSPGQLQLLVDRDLSGNPLPQPMPLDVAWQESMQLEGRQITFLGDVVVQQDAGWLRTRRLVLQLTEPVRFDGAAGDQPPQLAQIECWEDVVAEFEQRDISGVSSRRRLAMEALSVNQITGVIGGTGPGQIDSIHLAGDAAGLLALRQGGEPQAPGLVTPQQQALRHLHIDFVRGVVGNLHAKTVGVVGDVRAVYGPVATWDERLSMTPSGDPGPDEAWITCEELSVSESPLAPLNPQAARQVELVASGKVVIEGQVPKQGSFTAYGERAKYDQAKGMLILEGNGATPATIEQRPYPGAPSSPQTAQRMIFNHVTGHLKIEGLERGQFNRIQP